MDRSVRVPLGNRPRLPVRDALAHERPAARFANTDEGYARLAGFARKWEDRRWAVEGSRGAGRSLAQRLVTDGQCTAQPGQGQWVRRDPMRGRTWEVLPSSAGELTPLSPVAR